MPVVTAFMVSEMLPLKWNFFQQDGGGVPKLVAVVCKLF